MPENVTNSNQTRLAETLAAGNGEYYFPEEIRAPKDWTPYIQFTRHRIDSPLSSEFFEENFGSVDDDDPETPDQRDFINPDPRSRIRIMLPPTLSDQNSAIYDKEEMPFYNSIAEGATNLRGLNSQIEGLIAKRTNAKDAADTVIAGLDLASNIGMSTIAGTLRKMLWSSTLTRKLTGLALNPQVTYLFKTVNNRAFSFTFVMNPKNKTESDQIRRIIREFKSTMYPQARTDDQRQQGASDTGRDFYLRTPDIMRVCYYYGTEEHQWLHRFKDCVITGVNVEYGGQSGTWTQFNSAVNGEDRDGAPTQVTLNVTLEEINIITQADADVGY